MMMESEDYLKALKAVRTAAVLVSAVNLPDAIAWAEHTETVAPMLDPTLYREKGDALAQDIELFRAANQFRSAVGLMLARGLMKGVKL